MHGAVLLEASSATEGPLQGANGVQGPPIGTPWLEVPKPQVATPWHALLVGR